MYVETKQSLFIIAYPGKETAAEVYDTLRELEKRDRIDIKTAATIYSKDNGKLRLEHRQRLTLWKDEFGVGAIPTFAANDDAFIHLNTFFFTFYNAEVYFDGVADPKVVDTTRLLVRISEFRQRVHVYSPYPISSRSISSSKS